MSEAGSHFIRKASGLARQVSVMDALAMSLSGMGLLYVYNVTALIPAFYPSANPIASGLVGLIVVTPFALMMSLMAIAMPRTGGDYVWVSRIVNPSLGFISNFTLTILTVAIIGTVAPQAIQWNVAQIFYDFGRIYSNQGYLDMATFLQGQDAAFWASFLLVVLAGVIATTGVKVATAVVRYWTIISFVIGGIFVITILVTGQSVFISNFNALSGANYDAIVNAGQQAGAYHGIPNALSTATLYAGFLGLIGYFGFFYPSYFAGEVKDVRKSQFIGQIGSTLIFAAFTTIIIATMYLGMGPDFAAAMATLWANGSPQYPYIGAPLTSGLAMFWTQNPVLIALFSLSYAINIEVMNISILFTFARNLFAWSFDRVTPTKLADVNSRTHTPLNATIAMTLIAIFFVYVAEYQFGIVAATYSYGTAGIMLVFAVISLSAIIYPFNRKDIFEISHPVAKTRIAGLPVISLIGVLSFIESLAAVYALLQPALLNLANIIVEGIIPTWIAGIVVYAVSWSIRRRQGIDLGLAMREVPPL
jgi:APA family basic amino acid/polyamine antiporter